MTLQEQIKEFEDKWNITTEIFSNEDVYVYSLSNPLFIARFKDKSYFYARYNQKRITYPIQKSLFNIEFIKEFKILAKRVKKDMINDINREV